MGSMNQSMVFAIRMLELSLSAFLIGTTFVICVQYFRTWRKSNRHEWRGLLPLHVFVVTASYDLLLLYATFDIYGRTLAEGPPTWRLVILPPAYALGLVAMWTIGQFRRHRRAERVLRGESTAPEESV